MVRSVLVVDERAPRTKPRLSWYDVDDERLGAARGGGRTASRLISRITLANGESRRRDERFVVDDVARVAIVARFATRRVALDEEDEARRVVPPQVARKTHVHRTDTDTAHSCCCCNQETLYVHNHYVDASSFFDRAR